MKHAFVIVSFLYCLSGYSGVIRVTNPANSGTATLREAVEATANNGDTIVIEVKGDIVLDSPVLFDGFSNLTLIGPTAKHSSVKASGGFLGTTLFQISNCGTMKFLHLGFIGTGSANVRAVTVQNSPGTITFERSLFKGFISTSSGGALNGTNSTLRINGCSFVGNAGQKGGGVSFSTCTAFLENCTFSGNQASNQGGAVYIELTTSIQMVHNTFVFNTAVVPSAAFVSSGGTNSIFLQSNAISDNGSATQSQFGGGGTFTSGGGNIYKLNPSGDAMIWSPGPGDNASMLLNFNLRSPMLEDGYGLMYYPIVSPTSSLVNVGPVTTLQVDCRNAPRALKSTDVSPIKADAGACEYTPLRVLNTSGDASIANSLPWALHPDQNDNAVNFVEFDIPGLGPFVISPISAMNLGGNYTIDGFSQSTSCVPGPATFGSSAVSAAILPIEVQNTGAIAEGFNVQAASTDSKISGLRIVAFIDAGVYLSGAGTDVFGCEIGLSAAGTSVANQGTGVMVDANNCVVGGPNTWHRNVISGNATVGGTQSNVFIDLGTSGTKIQSNIIGLRSDGTDFVSGGNSLYGIFNLGGTSQIGSPGAGNVISGMNSAGLYCSACQNMTVQSNTIGLAANKTTAKSNPTGIFLLNAGSNALIGGAGPEQGNIVSGNSSVQIRVDAFAGATIAGNLIGPDKTGNVSPVTTTHGIYLADNAANNVVIGGTTGTKRNIISGNQNGIYLLNVGTGCQIAGNYIGLNQSGNAALANSVSGIIVQPSVTNTVQIGLTGSGNVVSGQALLGTSAINLSGTAPHIIRANIIGLDASGTAAVPNYMGIVLNSTNGVIIGGVFSAGEGNTISGNTLTGILVDNGASNTQIQGNKIGTNSAGSGAIANGGSGIEVRSASFTTIGGSVNFRNVISGNTSIGFAGITLNFAGSNTTISGNYIGTDANGANAIPNYIGVQIEGTHQATIGSGTAPNYIAASLSDGILENSTANCLIDGNFIGLGVSGASLGMGNFNGVHVTSSGAVIGQTNNTIIANNSNYGVFVDGAAATGVVIEKTIIGTDLTSSPGIGNGQDGIQVFDADGVLIGTSAGNTIIGNSACGIRLTGNASGATIQFNTIADLVGTGITNDKGIYLAPGTSGNTIGGLYGVDGNNTIGNSLNEGILIESSDNNMVYGNRIGNIGNIGTFPNHDGIKLVNADATLIGDELGKFNVISGNSGTGIVVDNATSTIIRSNLIGVNETGNGPLSNANGIEVLQGSSGTLIGGSGNPAYGNTISANTSNGIFIEEPSTTVLKNFIGTTNGGLGALALQDYGIVLAPGAKTCQIGGDQIADGNLIASNEVAGILVEDEGNLIYGNIIGVSPSYTVLGTQPVGIELDGADAKDNQIGKEPAGALNFGNVIMNNSVAGIRMQNAANDNLVSGNYIGISPTNVTFNTQNSGVEILNSAGINNQIGNDITGGGNWISGNVNGIKLNEAVHCFIYNNLIGTNLSGLSAKPNTNSGIYLYFAGFNTIGGSGLKANVISGNTSNGVILEGSASTENVIQGNIIGGSQALAGVVPNAIGIRLTDGATANHIGAAGTSLGNTITGNTSAGIAVSASSSNIIINNKIGLPFGNLFGVVIQSGSSLNMVGGSPVERNIISNNDSIGVVINASNSNVVSGNFIGTTAAGNAPAGNEIGIYLNGSDLNQFGGPGEINVISSNNIAGMILENANSNTVKNNYFGTDSTGNIGFAASGNGVGIYVKNSTGNQLGGNNTVDEENIVCNSINQGIYLENATVTAIYGNHIGINKTGTAYLPNTKEGVLLRQGSDNNFIGDTGTGFGNAIAANAKGIYITGSDQNTISSNFIGNNLNGTAVLGGINNQQTGIHLDSAATLNSILDGNVIAGNLVEGIHISGKNTKSNSVKGNFIGVNAGGSVGLDNGLTNIVLADSAKLNLIGGSLPADRNYLGGDAQFQLAIHDKADSNQIVGNYIGLGMNGTTTYTSETGVFISGNSRYNIVGGGLPGQGNTLVGFSQDGIRINDSHNTSILGNRIGIKPDNSAGTIGNAGVNLEGADYNWIGSYLVGSDSMNIITNCNTGVSVNTIFVLNSAYGNVIGGNSIYNNTNQGIDLVGDDLVMPIDTNNSNILIDNGGMDRPEIVSAWNCSNGNTWVGFKFYASNALPNYHVEFYRNPTPDPSGYGEGEVFLGDFTFSPATNHDTISVDLGQTLSPGTVLTATITGVLGNTSEFSEQYVITIPPALVAPVTTDETCLGADNGTVSLTAPEAYSFSYDGGTSWIYSSGSYNDILPTASYALDARYLNGCIQTQNITLNDGPPLPFLHTVVPDTCGLNAGEIALDTTVTNAAGGSGNYIYSFTGGTYYSGALDTLSIAAGTYNLTLLDTTLGCSALVVPVVVNTINDVVDESFVFTDFCSSDIPLPASIATGGGAFTFETTPGDGATIDLATGLITGPVIGNSYSVIYTVGICFEKDTTTVTALVPDDASFTMSDFCLGSPQSIAITGLPGGTFSFDPTPTDGASIDASTGQISGAGGSTYGVKYVTNGPCPDSTTITVNVFSTPAAPVMAVTDSIYCPGDALVALSVTTGTLSAVWTQGSSSGTVVGTSPTFTPASLATGNNYFFVKLVDVTLCESAADSINYFLADTSLMTAGSDIETCIGSQVQLNASGGAAYSWSVNDDLSDLVVADPVVAVDDVDFYSVLILDAYGCMVTDTVRVTLLPLDQCHVETYNAFSPNGDGKNDIWLIDGIEGYPQNTVTIFSRWGDSLLKIENYNNNSVIWDGYMTNGKLVPAGTYYFVVDVNGDQNQSGWVQVVH